MRSSRKFWIGVIIIAGAIIYLIVSSTRTEMKYFMTVEELLRDSSQYQDRSVRISGAVRGDSIEEDFQSGVIRFDIVNIPANHQEIANLGGMEKVLNEAVADVTRPSLTIIYDGAKPDLLKNAAQAVVTGRLNMDGDFEASELLLKCPSKYDTE